VDSKESKNENSQLQHSLSGSEAASKLGKDSKTPIIVISREHKLLPLAHRLRNVEHWPIEVVVWKRSYENAWQGMLEKDTLGSKHEIHESSVSAWIDRVSDGSLVALHDVPKLEGVFNSNFVFPILVQEANLEPSSVRLGFWWDGEEARLPHLLVYDMGAWPGGKGRKVPGGLTLITVSSDSETLWRELFDQHEFQLGSSGFKGLVTGFRGLVNVGLIEDRGKLVLQGWELGWPDLHTQTFMGAIEGSWGELLVNGVMPSFSKKFTVALPLSVPPWPGSPNIAAQGRSLKGVEIDLNHKLHKHVYWHDVSVDVEEKTLYTAGLDGLVGVVHVSSDSFENALQKCLGISNLVGLPDKQYRSDIGGGVRMLESQLQEHYQVHF